MYSVYKLNKRGDNIQSWCNPFPIWNQFIVPCPVLTVASWPANMFLWKQVKWSGILMSWRISTVLYDPYSQGFNIVNEAEIRIFLELLYFSYDPTDVGTLISGSSAFSKPSLYIWTFLVHVLFKPSLKDFEHYFASMWNECNCVVVWTFFGIAFLWDLKENLPFSVLWPLLSFLNLLASWLHHFHSIIF